MYNKKKWVEKTVYYACAYVIFSMHELNGIFTYKRRTSMP